MQDEHCACCCCNYWRQQLEKVLSVYEDAEEEEAFDEESKANSRIA